MDWWSYPNMRKSWKWILISVHIRLIGGFNAHEQCARQRGASSQIWQKITNIPNMSTPATPEHHFSAVFPNNNCIMFCFTYPLVIKHGNGNQHLWFPIRTSNPGAWFSIDFSSIFHCHIWFSTASFVTVKKLWRPRQFFCWGPRAAPATDGFARAWPGELRMYLPDNQAMLEPYHW